MAGTIPITQRKVYTEGAPNVHVQSNAPNLGGQVFGAIGQLGEKLGKIEEQNDHDAVIEAKANLDAWINDYSYGENGALMKQGKDALGTPGLFNQDFDTKIKEISGNMKNGRQQALFQQYVLTQKPTYMGTYTRHEAKEKEVYREANAKVAIDNAKKNAILNPFDDGANSIAVDTIHKTTKLSSGHLGGEYTGKVAADEISDLRVKQIEYLIGQKKGGDAQKFFDAHKGEIDPALHDNVNNAINKTVVPLKARTITDELFKKYGVTGERAATAELKEKHGNDPNYEYYSRDLQGKYVDERRFKKEDDEKEEESVVMRAIAAGSSSEADEIINNSKLPYGKKYWIRNQVKTRDKLLGSGKASEEQKMWARYERNGNLFKDVQGLRELNEIALKNDNELTPQQKTRKAIIMDRMTRYNTFLYGGGFAQRQTEMLNPTLGAPQQQSGNPGKLQDTFGKPQGAEEEDADDASNGVGGGSDYDDTFQAIKAEHPGATDEEIYYFLTKRYGG